MGNVDAPIAVFDSGLGGVSVLKEMMKVMPNEDMYYFCLLYTSPSPRDRG